MTLALAGWAASRVRLAELEGWVFSLFVQSIGGAGPPQQLTQASPGGFLIHGSRRGPPMGNGSRTKDITRSPELEAN